MSKSIKGVAGNAESLTGSAEEASAAVQKIISSIQQVAGNSESTAKSVEEIACLLKK